MLNNSMGTIFFVIDSEHCWGMQLKCMISNTDNRTTAYSQHLRMELRKYSNYKPCRIWGNMAQLKSCYTVALI